eukprot:4041732-Amphidinium_carterae.1
MIINHYENMKTLMKKAGCTTTDIKRAYDYDHQGLPGQDPPQQQQQGHKEDEAEDETQSAHNSSRNASMRFTTSEVTTQSVIHLHHATITQFYANAQQIPTITEESNETSTRPDQ